MKSDGLTFLKKESKELPNELNEAYTSFVKTFAFLAALSFTMTIIMQIAVCYGKEHEAIIYLSWSGFGFMAVIGVRAFRALNLFVRMYLKK